MRGEKTTKHKRNWVLGTAAVVICGLGIWYLKDDSLADHSDLEPARAAVETPGEAFETWLEVAESGDQEPWYEADLSFYESLAGREPWDGETAEKIIAANRQLIEGALAADKLGPFSLPHRESLAEPRNFISGFQKITKCLKVFAITRAREGDYAAAAEATVVSLRLSDRLLEGASTLIDLLVGVTCQAITYSTMEILADGSAPDEVLSRFVSELERKPEPGRIFREAVLREFASLPDWLELMRDNGPPEFWHEGTHPPRFLLKKNRTTNRFAAEYRELIRASETAPHQRRAAPDEEPVSGMAWIAPNAFGEYLLSSFVPPLWSILSKTDLAIANRRLHSVKLAAIRFRSENGTLPATLDQLVPDYLAAIPADPFDGELIRYDRDRGVVWVVGRNLSDEGGVPDPDKYGFGVSSWAPDPLLTIPARTPEP